MTLHHIQGVDEVCKNFDTLVKENGYLCIADLVREDGSFHSEYPDFDICRLRFVFSPSTKLFGVDGNCSLSCSVIVVT